MADYSVAPAVDRAFELLNWFAEYFDAIQNLTPLPTPAPSSWYAPAPVIQETAPVFTLEQGEAALAFVRYVQTAILDWVYNGPRTNAGRHSDTEQMQRAVILVDFLVKVLDWVWHDGTFPPCPYENS